MIMISTYQVFLLPQISEMQVTQQIMMSISRHKRILTEQKWRKISKNVTSSKQNLPRLLPNLVKTLDKAKKVLHDKQNRNNKYCHEKYKDTLACVQTQVLATHKSLSQGIEQWEKHMKTMNKRKK